MEGQKDDEGPGTSPLQRKAERSETVCSREENMGGRGEILSMLINI